MFKTLSSLISTFFFLAVIGLMVLLVGYWKISQELPDYHQLAKYEPPVTTRLYAGDGQLLMEYAAQKRLFVPENKIPEKYFISKHNFWDVSFALSCSGIRPVS